LRGEDGAIMHQEQRSVNYLGSKQQQPPIPFLPTNTTSQVNTIDATIVLPTTRNFGNISIQLFVPPPFSLLPFQPLLIVSIPSLPINN